MLSSFNPTEQLSLFWSLSRLLNHVLNDFIPFPCKNIEKHYQLWRQNNQLAIQHNYFFSRESDH